MADRQATEDRTPDSTPASPTTVRVAIEARGYGGRWLRDTEQTHQMPADLPAGALHTLAAEVMRRYGYVDAGVDDPRDTEGRPLRALVLPADPADGDDAAHALHVWGGEIALGTPAAGDPLDPVEVRAWLADAAARSTAPQAEDTQERVQAAVDGLRAASQGLVAAEGTAGTDVDAAVKAQGMPRLPPLPPKWTDLNARAVIAGELDGALIDREQHAEGIIGALLQAGYTIWPLSAVGKLAEAIDGGRHQFEADRDVPHRCSRRGCGVSASAFVHRTAAAVLAEWEEDRRG